MKNYRILLSWDRAVRLWDDGDLFSPVGNLTDQKTYVLLCIYLLSNGLSEPHVVAEGG